MIVYASEISKVLSNRDSFFLLSSERKLQLINTAGMAVLSLSNSHMIDIMAIPNYEIHTE